MDKKARKKKEREQKNREKRKVAARSPFEKLEAPPNHLRAVINANWAEARAADIIVRRELGPDTLAIAWFTIALDVGGLQAVSGLLDGTETEWTDAVAEYAEHGKMIPADPELIRSLIEGGAHIAATNGLRLPDKWDKWLHILGPAAVNPNPDLSRFDKGFYGPLSELRDRLVGYSIESFLARTDIDVNPEDDLGMFPDWGKPPEIVLDDSLPEFKITDPFADDPETNA